jgi:formiminoglutamase
MRLRPADPDLFFLRPDDPRLGSFVVTDFSDKKSPGQCLSIIGYPDDDGIALGGGRRGASRGPQEIRRHLYRMTPDATIDRDVEIKDLGDVDVAGPVAERHRFARLEVTRALEQGRVLTLGGGHDYGYPDAAAFCDWCEAQKLSPLIINIDAHLDVRPLDQGLTSGTPFFRLLSERPQIDFVGLGLQPQCNNRGHWAWCAGRARGLLATTDYQVIGRSFVDAATEMMTPLLARQRPVFLSIDIDAFSSAFAAGCSAPSAAGLAAQEFLPFYRWVLARANVHLCGLYEVAPPLDPSGQTERWAAALAHVFLFEGNAQW